MLLIPHHRSDSGPQARFSNGSVADEATTSLSLFAAHAMHEAESLASSAVRAALWHPSATGADLSAGSSVLSKGCAEVLSQFISASLIEKGGSRHFQDRASSRAPSSSLRGALILQHDLVAGVLLGMEADRVKRLAATPALLMLPAAEFNSGSYAPAFAVGAGKVESAATAASPAFHSMASAAPAAEAVEAAASAPPTSAFPEDGKAAIPRPSQVGSVPPLSGKPPLAPIPKLRIPSVHPAAASGAGTEDDDEGSISGGISMALLGTALFLSQVCVQILRHTLLITHHS